jgi:hypothetical protein
LQILLKEPHDCKPFSITLDTVYMDSCGIAINITIIINLDDLSKIEMSP